MNMDRIDEFEYIYIKCDACDERAKLVKNKGASFVSFDFLQDFINDHCSCDSKKLVLEFEK